MHGFADKIQKENDSGSWTFQPTHDLVCKCSRNGCFSEMHPEASAIPKRQSSPAAPYTARITVLATSDLHMQLTDFDYARDTPGSGHSLARLARVIRRERADADAENSTCLLFDNGDTLQGTPLAGYFARHPESTDNPMAACMNALAYDAAGLGNHDFDHGLPALRRGLEGFSMPVLGANTICAALPMLRRSAVLERELRCSDGNVRVVNIGVTSAVPAQTMNWNRHHLSDQAEITPPLPALALEVAALRRAGADVVIVLAHMGIPLYDEGRSPQNELAQVAQMPGVDAVIGGHTHLTFPGRDHAGVAGVDAENGRIGDTPVIMPGASASCLGRIRLTLERDPEADRWSVASSDSALLHPEPVDAPDPDIAALVTPAHNATRLHLNEHVGELAGPMHSYFALACPSPVPALIAATKRHVIATAVQGTELAELPLLSVGSTAATGGFDGPGNFISLSSGPIMRRHIAGLTPYANQIWAVRTNGARLIDWLERSALIFSTLEPDRPDQPLVDVNIPGFRFDSIYGLDYEIDPSRPPAYDPSGQRRPGEAGRILNVTWQGRALDPDQEFLVATTDHRTGGGGALKPFADEDIAFRGHAPMDEGLVEYLRSPDCHEVRDTVPWKFRTPGGCAAILLTAPDALQHLDEISAYAPESCGTSADGFARVRLHL